MGAMALPIEEYAIIGDLCTTALVGTDGSIDWLCLPHFDSGACFASLLGTEDNGFWRIAPTGEVTAMRRRYREGTLVLETEFETAEGVVRLTDCMPVREDHPQVVRVIEGVRGKVALRMELCIRFGYGDVVPWVTRHDGLLTATAGPDALALFSRVHTHGENMRSVAELTVSEGQQIPFTLTWFQSHEDPPRPVDAWYAISTTEQWWLNWTGACSYTGDAYAQAVKRSLITLKALTYEPTGGIVAAPTTSLPETLGGGRNWDYRYCWLRDATLTLTALNLGGYYAEAMAWRDWLLRAVAGDVAKLQIMYGASGERRLDEWEVEWLAGYEGSHPVRVGNAAAGQYQLDVYGEVMLALYSAARTEGSIMIAGKGGTDMVGPPVQTASIRSTAWRARIARAGSIVTSWRRVSRVRRIFGKVMRFMCGHRLQGRTKSTSGWWTATLSAIEHSVNSTTRAGFSRPT